jgi:CHAT domain-containing protein
MKVTLILAFCLILSWHLSAEVSTPAINEDAKQRADQLLELSEQQNLRNHRLALQTAQEALVVFQSVNDQIGIGNAFLAIGRYYYALNRMNEAARNYELSLQIWQQTHDTTNEAIVLTQLGYVEGRQGEWLNSFSYLTRAQSLLNGQNDTAAMAGIAAGMGFTFNESGIPDQGLVQYQRALEYYQQGGATRQYNRQLMMVGYTNFLLGKNDLALSYLQQALQLFKTSDNTNKEFDSAECDEYIGEIYLSLGKYPLALEHLLPIPAFYKTKGNDSDGAQVKALIGQVYERQKMTGLARAGYQAALENFRETADPVRRAAVAFALGRLEFNQGNYDTAESYLKESIDTTEDIRYDLNSRMLATAFSATVHDRYETYIECLMRRYKKQPDQQLELLAFQASELARARSLAALLRDTQTKIVTGVDPDLAERERSLRQAIRAKGENIISLLATNYTTEQLVATEKSLTGLREQHRKLTQELQKQNPRYDQIDKTAYSVQQLQQLIVEDNDTMLLEYFLGKNAGYAWAITRTDARVYELRKADEITDAVRVVYNLLEQKPNNETEQHLNKASSELAQMILAPLADRSGVKRVIVVADGALNYIPFQLLPAPGNQTPLVANYEIVNAPSASILAQLRQENQQRRASKSILAAFGDPAFRSNYAQFKNSAASANAVASASERGVDVDADSLDPDKIQPLVYSKFELANLSEIAGAGAFVATGFKASRAVLETTDFSKYAILHFATHGLLDPQNPQKSGFFLSTVDEDEHDQNGFITMEDVYNLRVPVALVVLSACRTGLGKDVRGEGLIGLTRGFMHAGASSVVASLWKVDDEATAELMKYFYTNMLKKGLRPAAALREAQNTLRQNPQWRSPHFWAGFTLQGEFKNRIKLPPPTTAPRAVQNAVGFALLLSLLAALAWGFRRRI